MLALAHHRCFAEWHRVRAVRHLGAAESIQSVGLAEKDRVGVPNRLDQKSLGIVGIGRHYDLDPGCLHELRLHRVRVELGAADATTERGADRHLAVVSAARALAVFAQLWADLVESLSRETEELDLRHR